jgi:hypothetical protein
MYNSPGVQRAMSSKTKGTLRKPSTSSNT